MVYRLTGYGLCLLINIGCVAQALDSDTPDGPDANSQRQRDDDVKVGNLVTKNLLSKRHEGNLPDACVPTPKSRPDFCYGDGTYDDCDPTYCSTWASNEDCPHCDNCCVSSTKCVLEEVTCGYHPY